MEWQDALPHATSGGTGLLSALSSPPVACSRLWCSAIIQPSYIGNLNSLRALLDVELHYVILIERLVARTLNGGEVAEHIGTASC